MCKKFVKLVDSVENPSNLVNVAIKVSDLYERMGKKMLFDWCPNPLWMFNKFFRDEKFREPFRAKRENFSNISSD